MNQERARGGKAFEQPLDAELVHQEADGTAVHPENGKAAPLVEQLVQHVEQKAVAAERDQQVGLGQVDEIIQRAQFGLRLLARGRVRCDERDLALHKRSEEHTSELQSLMRISYAVFCLNKKT